MSRNQVTTPEGPGQGQSSTDITSPNARNDIFTHNQFLPYPMYPPIYHYPLTQPITSLLPIPPPIIPTQAIQFQPKPNNNKNNYKKKYHNKKTNRKQNNNTNRNTDEKANNNNTHKNKKEHVHKSKTVDLSRNNSRGELETLVRWIGGDSVQIKHHCSQDSIHNEWHCVCTVPLPFQTQNTNILQTKSKHSKKKDAIKIASKLMIKEILKKPLPISIDIIGNDGNITCVQAKLNKTKINQNRNSFNINIHKNNNDNAINESSDDDDYVTNNKQIGNSNISIKNKVKNKNRTNISHASTPFDNKKTSNKIKNNNGHYTPYMHHGPPPYDYDQCYHPQPPQAQPPPMPPYHHHHHHTYYHGDWYPRSYYPPYYPPPSHSHSQQAQYQKQPQTHRYRHHMHTPLKKDRDNKEKKAETNNINNNETDDEISTLNGDIIDRKEDDEAYLFENNETDDHDHINLDDETDDGVININIDITPKGTNNINKHNNDDSNDDIDIDDDDEYMNELKEEEIAPKNQNKVSNNKKIIHNNNCNDCKEKEKEGGFVVPPQRLLVLVPSYLEYKTIESILPSARETFVFSKKFNISGVIVASYACVERDGVGVHVDEQCEAQTEAPGEQNRLYIVQCGTGLINVSLCIGIIVQRVHIDAILLLGHAISLKPKSIKPGHLLLPNSIIQHDLCHNDEVNNDARFEINYKLAQWIKTLINKRSEKENETLPVMYEGILLSGSEIVKSQARIAYFNDNKYYNDNQAMAVDRESISVAIICRMLRIPFVILKSIAPPKFDGNEINFEAYDDTCSNNAIFDCNASIPAVRALLKEYTMLDY